MSNVVFHHMIILRDSKHHSFCHAMFFVVVLRFGFFSGSSLMSVYLGLILIVMPSGMVSLSIELPCLIEAFRDQR
jgi:hypothetical protein